MESTASTPGPLDESERLVLNSLPYAVLYNLMYLGKADASLSGSAVLHNLHTLGGCRDYSDKTRLLTQC